VPMASGVKHWGVLAQGGKEGFQNPPHHAPEAGKGQDVLGVGGPLCFPQTPHRADCCRGGGKNLECVVMVGQNASKPSSSGPFCFAGRGSERMETCLGLLI
jgi:hypothetical protein